MADFADMTVAAAVDSVGVPAGGKTRLLMIDDEQRILQLFAPLLEDSGFYVRTASTPDEALGLLRRDMFHIAFVDQFLGPVKGLDLCEEMSAASPGLHFVVMTACASPDLAVEAMKRGASDFLSKPFFIGDFLRSIEYVRKKIALEAERSALVASLEKKAGEKEQELKMMHFSVLSALAQAMEKKDIGTYGHSRRVCRYVELIASTFGLGDAEREQLKVVSLLHDIGKIGISDFILGKRERLSREEMDVVRSHPMKGVEILRPLKQFEPALPGILHHHESFDGSGYPAGLTGREIPLDARIVAVADAYDAILSNRPYRAGASHEEAIAELVKCARRQFDPAIVDAFVGAEELCREMFPLSEDGLFHDGIL